MDPEFLAETGLLDMGAAPKHRAADGAGTVTEALALAGVTGAPVRSDLAAVTAANRGCFCKASRCMKAYCVCFASGAFCGPECSCTGCGNTQDHVDEVRALVLNLRAAAGPGAPHDAWGMHGHGG